MCRSVSTKCLRSSSVTAFPNPPLLARKSPATGGAKVDGVRHLASPVSPSLIKSQEPKVFCLTPDSIRAIFSVTERGVRSYRASSSPPAFAPIPLRLALHRRRIGVLHFEPIGGAPGTVDGILALRDDAFEAKLAGMSEDGLAVAFHVFVVSFEPRVVALSAPLTGADASCSRGSSVTRRESRC